MARLLHLTDWKSIAVFPEWILGNGPVWSHNPSIDDSMFPFKQREIARVSGHFVMVDFGCEVCILYLSSELLTRKKKAITKTRKTQYPHPVPSELFYFISDFPVNMFLEYNLCTSALIPKCLFPLFLFFSPGQSLHVLDFNDIQRWAEVR